MDSCACVTKNQVQTLRKCFWNAKINLLYVSCSWVGRRRSPLRITPFPEGWNSFTLKIKRNEKKWHASLVCEDHTLFIKMDVPRGSIRTNAHQRYYHLYKAVDKSQPFVTAIFPYTSASHPRQMKRDLRFSRLFRVPTFLTSTSTTSITFNPLKILINETRNI